MHQLDLVGGSHDDHPGQAGEKGNIEGAGVSRPVGTDQPCVILMAGARSDEGTIVYPRSETAARHGASVEAETSSPHEAYAAHPHWQPGDPGRLLPGLPA